jgi:hypothetical protein
VLALKQLACDSIIDLMLVLEHLKMWSPLKNIIQLVLKMITDDSDSSTGVRDQALEYLVS